MVSIDTDKLIRDKADNLAAALLKHIGWAGQGTARPDLVEIELLDAVIEVLTKERAVLAARPMPHKVECSACKSTGRVRSLDGTRQIPCVACEGIGKVTEWRTAGASEAVRNAEKKARHAIMYGAGPMKAATPADVHRIVDSIRMNRGRR